MIVVKQTNINPIYRFKINMNPSIRGQNIFSQDTFTLQTGYTDEMNVFCLMQFVRNFIGKILIENRILYDLDYDYTFNTFETNDGEEILSIEFLGMTDTIDPLHFENKDLFSFFSDLHVIKTEKHDEAILYCIVNNLPLAKSSDYDYDVRIPLSCKINTQSNTIDHIKVLRDECKQVAFLFENDLFKNNFQKLIIENAKKILASDRDYLAII